MPGDIAVLAGGDIAVLNTGGNLMYIPVANIPAPDPPTVATNFSRRCNTLPLYRFDTTYSAYTGLATGYRSDVSVPFCL